MRPRETPQPLFELLARTALECRGADTVLATGISHDSRQVQRGDIYAALPGFTVHGADFAGDAVAAGAVAVLTDAAGADRLTDLAVPVLVSTEPRADAGRAAAWVYGDPAESLLTIGITGTNGKTTTASLVEAGLRAGGHVPGVVGTLGAFVGELQIPTSRTTPEATDLHALLAVMVERGVTAVVMEVSSHALVLERVAGLVVDVAGFTNLSQDHLDFHGSMDEYFAAKASLFTPGRSRRGVVTVDDQWGRRLADHAGVPIVTVAAAGSLADWQVLRSERRADGRTTIEIRQPDGTGIEIDSALAGSFNVANMTLALALLRTAGVSVERAVAGLSASQGVPGRMERVDAAALGFDVLVDYAHSPDAIDRVIASARQFTAGRVIVLLGGGGDRDRAKRPQMGRSAAAGDMVIVTDDNPRSEDPADIRRSILSGVPSDGPAAHEVADRRAAIALAINSAEPGDCVLLLGKGHETGQEVAGVVTPFDDRHEAAAAVDERLAARGGARR